MKSVNVKCLLCITILALVVVNQAESDIRVAPDVVGLAVGGELVIVGKLLAAEEKVDTQIQVQYTDVVVEVVQVIRNITEQEIKVGATINFRLPDVPIGYGRFEAEFSKEEIGDLLLLPLKRPHPRTTVGRRKGFDTIFDVYGGDHGKHTVRIKNDLPMVYLFGLKRRVEDPQFRRSRNRRLHNDHYRELEIGLPLDWVLEVMNIAIIVNARNPVKNPKDPGDIPAEIRLQYERLRSLEKSVRKLARDGRSEASIIKTARKELDQFKEELDLEKGNE
ncbi:hypothetical protein C6502_01805 [Candidatus Poribacteria bacterium]|nr:MAG: hypothetical protein C6502_01805 [Candidatus Poribacteria bacterium]